MAERHDEPALRERRTPGLLARSVPVFCAGANALAALATPFLLGPGSELERDPARRLAYVSEHLGAWRFDWALWMIAALALVAFYGWWAARIGGPRMARAGFLLASIGLACDWLVESLYIGWMPRDFAALAAAGLPLSAGLANGLYTLGGSLLTRATPGLPGWLRAWTWCTWASGAALATAGFLGSPPVLAVSAALLMLCFCPWVLVFARHLERVAPRPEPGDR